MSLFLKSITFGTIGIFTLIALIYFIVGFEHVWSSISGEPSTEIIEISDVKKTPKPNQYLVCPAGFCNEVADRVSPVFNVSIDKLRQVLANLESKDTNFSLVNSDPKNDRQKYVMRSPFWRFPNLISIEYITLENGQSAIAIYAQAQLGQSDLGANKMFIDDLLRNISTQI